MLLTVIFSIMALLVGGQYPWFGITPYPGLGCIHSALKRKHTVFLRQASGLGSSTPTLTCSCGVGFRGEKLNEMKFCPEALKVQSRGCELASLWAGAEAPASGLQQGAGCYKTSPRVSQMRTRIGVSLSSHSHPSILLSLLPLLTTFLRLPTACTPTPNFD